MAKPLTNKERDRILEQYTHTIEGFTDESDIDASPEVRWFEEAYAYDTELLDLMRQVKEKKKRFLAVMAGKLN